MNTNNVDSLFLRVQDGLVCKQQNLSHKTGWWEGLRMELRRHCTCEYIVADLFDKKLLDMAGLETGYMIT